MTVASETAKAGPFLCDGVQTEFPFPFKVLDPSHVSVYLNSIQTEESYTVVLFDDGDSGGQVIFDNPPADGSTVVILRNVPLNQLTDIQNHTAFLPEIIESALDKLTMLCQQLREQISRGIQVPPGGDTTPEALLSSIWQANADSMIAASAAAESAQHAEDVSHPLGNGAFNRSDDDAFFRNSFNSLRIWWADQFSPEEAQLLSYDEEAQVYKTEPMEDENADQIQYQLEWRTGGQSSAQATWHLAKYVNSVEEESFLCRIPNSSSDDPRGNGFPVSGNDQNTLKFTILGDSDNFLGSLKTGTSERLARNLRNEILNRVWISEEFSPAKNTLFQFSHNLNLSEEQLKRAHGEVLFYWNRDTDSYGYTKGDMIHSPQMMLYLITDVNIYFPFATYVEIEKNTVLFPMHDHIVFTGKDPLGRFISLDAEKTQKYLLAKIRIFY